MNTREELGGSRSAPFPVLTLERIKLPVEIILRLAKLLPFEDFHNFVRALWPNMNEGNAVRAALWSLSEHNITTTFINGKQLNIRYNFNPYRSVENRILMDRTSLLPIFGGIILPTMNEFVSMTELHNFVKMHVHLNKCSDYRYASCPCHLPYCNIHQRIHRQVTFTAANNNCRYRHFHHYCSEHVSYWLQFYLEITIGLQATGADTRYSEEAEQFLMFLDDTVYFQGGRPVLRNVLH
ncbi:repeat element 17 [Diadegma semiclausum ichnovirus]|nr:repeat element 17 [Diadegma semiclausum ichnovirus]